MRHTVIFPLLAAALLASVAAAPEEEWAALDFVQKPVTINQ